jgi:hypothetical protein
MKTYHKNPRQITERQFKDLERWLEELGDLGGIVHDLNSDEVIGGNQRARVFDILRQENAPIVLTDEFDPPTRQGTVALGYIQWRGEQYGYRQVRWTARQCEQANVVANRAGGAWDWDVLANEFEMGDLLEWGFTEFDFQMAGLALPEDEPPEDPGPQIDKAAELQEKWGTKLGQVWELGEHRLVCGDCTDKVVVEAVMRGKRAQLCLTDPPYATGGVSDGYDVQSDELITLINKFLPLSRRIPDRILLTPGNAHQFLYPEPTWILAWFVQAGVGANPWGFTFWNAVFAYGKDPYLERGLGSRPDAFVKTEASEKTGHPTSKPVGVWEWLVERGSINGGDIIYDPFLGSGTTLIACERLGRKCRGIEIEPKYIAVTLERWHQMTGVEPVLVSG